MPTLVKLRNDDDLWLSTLTPPLSYEQEEARFKSWSVVTENLPLKVFVQWFNATWFSVQKKGVKCGRSVDLVVVRDKHLFSDTPGRPPGSPSTAAGTSENGIKNPF